MKTSSAKAKGRRCAAEVRELLLKDRFELREEDINITSSGETGPDLKLSPAALQLYPFVIECKNVEALNVWNALEQAESHKSSTEDTRTPVLFFRRNRSKLYVALEAEDFVKLVQRG